MKIAIILVTLLIATTSIAGDKFKPFRKQVDSFIAAAHQQHVNVDLSILHITLADHLPDRLLGICWGMGTSIPMIFLDKVLWEQSNDLKREQILWHEMGHCVLKREHNERMKWDGYPASIMYPDSRLINDQNYYRKHKQEYIQELFHPRY